MAKEARLFEKHGLDVAPVLIPSSVRTLQEMASNNPKAASLNAKDLVDARFVKELENGGFVAGLSKK